MSDLDDFDLDDFEFDDSDLGFPDLDDPDRIPTKREAIVNSAAAAAEGLKTSLISTSSVEDMISRSLPDGYSQALGVKDVAISAINQIKNDTAEDFKPLTTGLKKGVRKILPRVESKLPKWFLDRLESFSEPENSYASSDESQEEKISAEIAGIFKATAEKDNAQRSEEKAERLIRDRVEETKFETTAGQLSTIARGVGRLVGFNEDVQVAISKKSLEIQLKSFYMFKNYADVMTARSGTSETALKEIVKNTGLPDVIKIQKSEIAGRMLSEKIIGGGLESLSQFSSNYVTQLSKNISSSIKGMVGGGGGGFDQMQEMYASLADMDPAQRNEVIASMGGGMLGDELRIQLSDRIKPGLSKNEKVQEISEWFKHNLTDWQSRLSEYAKSSTEDFGWKGQFEQTLKDILPKYYMNETLPSDNLISGDKASYFDNTTHRSINQVIPSLLVSTNRWLQMMATGEWVEDEDTEVYNVVRGQMTTKGRANKDLSERIVDRSTRISVGDRIDTLMKQTVGDGELSAEATEALRKHYVEQALRNERFNAKDLADSSQYSADLPTKIRDEISEFFRQKYYLEYDGEIMDGKEDEYRRLSNPALVAMRDLKDTMPTTGSTVRALVETYGVDTLKQTGFVRQAGSKNIINREHIVNQLLSGSEDINEVDTTIEEEERKTLGGFKSPKMTAPPKSSKSPNVRFPTKIFHEMNAALQHIDKTTDNIFKRMCVCKEDTVSDIPSSDSSERLSVLASFKEETGKHLFEILEQLKINGAITISLNSGENPDSMFSKIKRGGKKGFDLTKGYLKGVCAMYGGMFTMGLASASAIGNVVKDSAVNNFKKYTNRADIYVRGERTPRLYAQLMEQGLYHDALTLEPIMSIDDIKGPVLDDEGNYILTQEDIDRGLHTSLGTSVLGGIGSGALKLAKGYLNLSLLPYKLVIGGATKAFNWTKDKIKEINDVYIRGEKSPRLLARLLEQGDYYYDTVLKRYITDPREIKGDITDAYGNIVLKFEEIQRGGGLFKRNGESIFEGATSFAKGLFDKAKVPVMAYVNAVKGAYKFAKELTFSAGRWALGKLPFGKVSLTGNFESDLVKIGHSQLSVQERILQVLIEMRGDQVKDMHDRSGDGFRDGSWQEQRYGDNPDNPSEEAAGEGGGKYRNGATWGGVAAGAKGAYDRFQKKRADKKAEADKKKAEEAGEGGLTTGNGVADAAIGTGTAAAVWQSVKTGGGRALGFVKKHSKKLVKEVGKAAVKNPRVAIAVTVGGGALYLMSGDKKVPNYLAELRFIQYGADLGEEDQVNLVASIEKLLLPAVVVSGDSAHVDGSKVDMNVLFNIVGIKASGVEAMDALNVKQLLKYLTKRFQPTLLKHYMAWKQFVGTGSFQEIDKNIPYSKGLEFLDYVGSNTSVVTNVSEFAEEILPAKILMSGFSEKYQFTKVTLLPSAMDEMKAIANAKEYFKDKIKEFKDNSEVTGRVSENIYKIDKVRRDKEAAYNESRMKAENLKRNAFTGGKRQVLDTKTGKMVYVAPATTVATGALVDNKVTMTDSDGKVTITTEKALAKMERDIRNERFSAVRSTRYYTYGLTAPDIAKYESLYKLEELVHKELTYSGRPVYSGDINQLTKDASAFFDIASMSAKELSDWTTWLTKRFIPTFIEFAYNVRKVAPYSVLMADKFLSVQHALQVARGTTSARYKNDGTFVSVWTIKESPWKGETSNQDRTSVSEFLESLQAAVVNDLKKANSSIVIHKKTIPVPDTFVRKDTNEKIVQSGTNIPVPQNTLPGKSNISYNIANSGVDNKSTLSYGRGGSTFGTNNAPTFSSSGNSVPTVHGGREGDFTAVPMATGNGWDNVKNTIVGASNVVGFDPGTAATMAGVESSMRPDVVNGIGAAGLFQIVPSTWKELMDKHGDEYGIPKGTPSTDHRANAILGIRYLRDNHKTLTKKQDNVTDVDLYLTHFLGPTGAGRFAKGLNHEPSNLYASSAAVRNNPDIFTEGGHIRTIGEVKRNLDMKLDRWRNVHGLATLGPGVTMTQDETPQPVSYDNDVLAGMQQRPTGAIPQPHEEIEYTGPQTSPKEAEQALLSEQGEFAPPAKGDVLDGAGASNYLIANGNNLDGLNPEFKKNLFGMVEEYGATTGKKVPINAAFRSYQEQAAMKAKYGARAASPGRSLHEFGLAADLNTVTLNEMEKLGLMKKYGFTRPVGGETWHIEPAGIQGDIEGFKRNPQAAAMATAASLGKGGGGLGLNPNARKYSRDTAGATSAFNAGPSVSGASSPSMGTFAPREEVPTPAMDPSGARIAAPTAAPAAEKSDNSSLVILEKQLSIQTSSHALFETMVSLLTDIGNQPQMQTMPNVQDGKDQVKELHVNRSVPMDTMPVSNVRRRAV